jgi:UDP-3-O-[3-hydroxymyristoyl] glucosamine N-acyltransferase
VNEELGVGVYLGRGHLLGELCRLYGGTLPNGLRGARVDRIVSPRHAAHESDLVVVTSPRFVYLAKRVPGSILCDENVAPRLPPDRCWIHEHVWWVVANVIGPDAEIGGVAVGTMAGYRDPAPEPSIHPRAQVHPAAKVAPTAIVRAGAVVQAGVQIGHQSVVGENAVIFGGVRIGARVRIGPGAVIGKPGFGFAHGPSGEVVRIPQLGGVVLGDGVEIGALCTVDAGTLAPTYVGAGSKLDAHVHVGHNVEIGEGAFVAAQVGFAGSSLIGRGVQIGGQSGIADHVHVGDGVRVAAKSGVIGDIESGAVVAGFPAVSRMRWLRAMAALLRPPKGERH